MSQNHHPLFSGSHLNSIEENTVVAFHYKLTIDGDVIDNSFGKEPLLYLHGAAGIVPGLEREMAAKKIGDTFHVDVEPEDGYGNPSGLEPIEIKRSEMPPDLPLQVGLPIPAEVSEGKMILFHVVDLNEDSVFLSFDHPLAGKTLHFDIEVVDIRLPTEVEKEHGHPHGFDGKTHHH